MASFDVEALLTNIPRTETVNIQFRNLLELVTKESLFVLVGTCYQQTDGVVMGSPFVPTLANIFLNWKMSQTV